ncbi:HSP70-14 [Symbiodinium microadriaticum]|nr:HSP70-14 [Symbiodinium microadriaticum]
MRDKLDTSLGDFATNSEKSQFRELIDQTETWLYEDGFDSTKNVYIKKLDELKVLGNPIEKRLWEQSNRQDAVDAMKRQIEICRTFSSDNSEEWLYDQLEKQGELAPYNDPVITVDSIGAKRKTLHTATKDIMNRPKPVPKKEEKPPADDKKDAGDSKSDGENGAADAPSDAKSDNSEAGSKEGEESAKEGEIAEGAKDMEA